MITNPESQYGVVRRMREIRDEINAEIMNMTWEDQKAYFQKAKEQWNAECKQKENANDN